MLCSYIYTLIKHKQVQVLLFAFSINMFSWMKGWCFRWGGLWSSTVSLTLARLNQTSIHTSQTHKFRVLRVGERH